MGVLQRLKEGISRIVKPKKANEQISYTSQTTEKYQDNNGRDVVRTATKVSDQPIKKPIDQKLNEKMQRHDENTRGIIGRAKEAVSSEVAKIKGRKAQAEESGTGKAVRYLQTAPQRFVSKAAEKTGTPEKSKGISQQKAIIAVRKDVAIIGNPLMTTFAGVPARTFEEKGKRGKKTLYGSRISKKEEQKLKQKYGRNWRAYLQKDKRNRLYTTSDPITMAGIKREQKRTATSTDFGSAFIPQGMSAPLNKEHASVPFAKRSDDPFDIDAMFMGGGHVVSSKSKRDPFNIDANFKGKLKL